MHISNPAHDPIEAWPADLGFVPFVGPDYQKGIDGIRFLILGESHYGSTELLARPVDQLRGFTREIFDGCERNDGKGRAWGTFFRRCDSIAAGKDSPSPDEAAEGWRKIAFANFIQTFAGTGARQRPSTEQWNQARSVFPLLLEYLRPDAILVLGWELWKNLPNDGQAIDAIEAPIRNREVWLLPFPNGEAIATWAFHPSWPKDGTQTYVSLRNALLERARARKCSSKCDE